MSIRIDDLTVTFKNGVTAVDHVDLEIPHGIFGLLGENGAGKTTLMRVLTTVLAPTSGKVLLDGTLYCEANYEKIQKKIGYLPQEIDLYPSLTVRECLEYMGDLAGIEKRESKKRIDYYLEKTSLADHQKKKMRQLSGGMKRKLMVCRALLTDPEILLLDEPTAGMDALSRRQMWNLLRKLNEKNLTILLTTHYMEEAQSLCNRVALMDHGKLEEVSTPSALIESLGAYAVDEMTADGTQNHYFHTRQEAIRYLEELTGQASLRETTLEDVFVERAGKHLISK